MSTTLKFQDNPHIGVFSRIFEEIAVIPPEAPEDYRSALVEHLDVELVTTSIQGSAIIGSLLAGNSRGAVVSGLALEEERAVLEEYLPVFTLKTGMNAAGNVILANDVFVAVHPDMDLATAEEIGSFLGVPVVRLTLGGIKTVGMAGVVTNTGVLVHPRVTEHELSVLEAVCDLPIGTGSVNMGSGLVGTGLVANSKGYLAGTYTSGFELGRIEEVFGFME